MLDSLDTSNQDMVEKGDKGGWQTCDEHLKDMYTAYDGKKEILFWCYARDPTLKHQCSSDNFDESTPSQKCSRYDTQQVDKMREVDEIEDKTKISTLKSNFECGRTK